MLIVEGLSAAAGVALALWSARRTRYVKHNAAIHYIPHTVAGIAISLLVIGRIAYRSMQAYSTGYVGDPAGSSAAAARLAPMQNPATVGLLFVLIGYYVCYYSRVLWKSRHIEAQDLEAAADGPAGGPISTKQ
jgi:hypothetical protein